ncbi:hypothetical protein NMY3_01744 [Candidatus Nitrosocosmicus oleophilus]|uniref:Uncharacterized protein n=1 Tax=Candidatus Nitrosocosmicus oleophilus TaxID=1353260 RepID=A0A654LYA1_9ARCH|nr:hypothetical protein [Candidatus Nitrosocosmicus oleophilus]ALI35947.1 hypothetical protein NMY3_01744 [Candidatus Nitrosocosmicus oleophilus]
MDNLLKSVLKRQMPYLIGGTITGSIMAYYYGFLFTIIVNSISWFVISTLVNKHYWNYTGFKEEFQLILKYMGRIRKNKSKINITNRADNHTEKDNIDYYSSIASKDNNKPGNFESIRICH